MPTILDSVKHGVCSTLARKGWSGQPQSLRTMALLWSLVLFRAVSHFFWNMPCGEHLTFYLRRQVIATCVIREISEQTAGFSGIPCFRFGSSGAGEQVEGERRAKPPDAAPQGAKWCLKRRNDQRAECNSCHSESYARQR
eukprot:gene9355-biopygen1669